MKNVMLSKSVERFDNILPRQAPTFDIFDTFSRLFLFLCVCVIPGKDQIKLFLHSINHSRYFEYEISESERKLSLVFDKFVGVQKQNLERVYRSVREVEGERDRHREKER